MPEYTQEARLNGLTGAFCLSVFIYLNVPNIQEGEKKNQCNCYIKDIFRSTAFRSTDLLLPARSYQIA